MTSEPFVSVVTPFYNSDEYLAECIESVLAQTYRNFEYVLVDNHSTDRSGAIAEAYARKDSRIRFLRADQFRNQIRNYNYSLSRISGTSRYVKIAQADDWLYPRCITELVELAERNSNVGLVSSYEIRGRRVFGTGLSPEKSVFSGREAARAYFLEWLFPFGSPTTVLYRADLVRERPNFFPEVLHTDTEVAFRIFERHDFGFVHQVLCFIRTQDDSFTGRIRKLSDDALDRLIITKRYARAYLDESEYAACLAGVERWYYDDLARRWISDKLGEPNAKFWEFHRNGLETIGETVDRGRVIRAALGIVMEKLTNPGQAFLKLRDRRRNAPPPR